MSSSGSPPKRTCVDCLSTEASRMHPEQIHKPSCSFITFESDQVTLQHRQHQLHQQLPHQTVQKVTIALIQEDETSGGDYD